MENTRNLKSDWLRFGATLLVLVIALPLLAAVLFFARFVVVALAVVALVGGAVLFFASSRFREWLTSVDTQEVQYKGLRLATNVAVSPVHAWTRREGDRVVVGSDDVAPAVLGPVSAVELPAVGSWFRRGEPIAHLRRGERSVALRAPVSGFVVGRNDALHWRPELVNDQPYTGGWLVRLRIDGARDEPTWLQRGRHARTWFRTEVDRLIGTLSHGEGLAHAVADGGPLVGQLYREIDDETWQRLSRTFFGGRSEGQDQPR